MRLNFNVKKKHLLVFVLFTVVALGVFVVAYGGNSPSQVGHTFGEIQGLPDPSTICTTANSGDGDCVDGRTSGSGGGLACGDVPGCDQVGTVNSNQWCKGNSGGLVECLSTTPVIVTAGTGGISVATSTSQGVNTYTVSATGGGGGISGVTAGNGLTGGGTSGTVNLNVGAGTGIAVAADAVSLDIGGLSAGGTPSGTDFIPVRTGSGNTLKYTIDSIRGSGGGGFTSVYGGVGISSSDENGPATSLSFDCSEVQASSSNVGIGCYGEKLGLDINELTAATIGSTTADYIPFYRSGSSYVRKVNVNDLKTGMGLALSCTTVSQGFSTGSAGEVSCSSGWTRTGGGALCSSGIDMSYPYPTDPLRWRASCGAGSGTVYVVCCKIA